MICAFDYFFDRKTASFQFWYFNHTFVRNLNTQFLLIDLFDKTNVKVYNTKCQDINIWATNMIKVYEDDSFQALSKYFRFLFKTTSLCLMLSRLYSFQMHELHTFQEENASYLANTWFMVSNFQLWFSLYGFNEWVFDYTKNSVWKYFFIAFEINFWL